MKKIFNTIGITFALIWTTTSFAAASTVNLTPAGSGVFFLEGSSFQNIAALDITITYSTGSLSNPKVVQGNLISGALMIANTKTPGTIRMAVVHHDAMTGSGNIATITFIGSGSGDAISLSATALDPAGKTVSLVAAGNAADSGQSTPPPNQQETQPAAPPATAQQMPGQIIAKTNLNSFSALMTEDTTSQQPKERTPDQPEPEKADVPLALTGPEVTRPPDSDRQPAKSMDRVFTQQSALYRFSTYKGARTPESLTGLMTGESPLGYRQDPIAAISNGASTIRVTIISSAENNAPQFTARNGRIVSVEKDRDRSHTWIVTIRPDKDTYDSSVAVRESGVVRELSLTVSPKADVDLDGSGTVTIRDFQIYLDPKNNRKTFHYPVAGGKRTSYLDDFVFTANYAAANKKIRKGDAKGH